MKQYTFLTLLLASFFVLAEPNENEQFHSIEELFSAGHYFEVEKGLKELLSSEKKGLTPELRKRAESMLQYLERRDQEQVDKVIKKVDELLQQKNPDPEVILTEVSDCLLIARDWKQRQIPQWSDLSQKVSELLKRIDGKIDRGSSLKVLLYRAEIQSLRAEYHESIATLQSALEHYYPKGFTLEKLHEKDRESACYLYILLGDQYVALAEQAQDRPGKQKYFLLAGSMYLKGWPGLKKESPTAKSTVLKIRHCAQALSLLGVQLAIPPELKQAKNDTFYPVIAEMIENKRFSAGLKAVDAELGKPNLNNEKRKELHYWKVAVLHGLRRYRECAEYMTKNGKEIASDPARIAGLMRMAEGFEKDASQEDTLKYFAVLRTMELGDLDRERVLFQCANYSVKCGEYAMAATCFESAARQTKSEDLRINALFQAAQAAYRLQQDSEVLRLLEELLGATEKNAKVNLPQVLILQSQSAIRLKKFELAEETLKKLLVEKEAANDIRPQVLLLSASTAYQQKKYPEADGFFVLWLKENKTDESYFDVLTHLKEIRKQELILDQLLELCTMTLSAHPEAPQTYHLILELSGELRKKKRTKDSIAILNNLLKINKLSTKQLFSLSTLLTEEGFDSERQLADALGALILAEKLPELNSEPMVCELYFRLAKFQSDSGTWPDALQTIEQILSQKTNYRMSEVYYLQGITLERCGRWKEASGVWRKLLSGAKKARRTELIRRTANAEMNAGEYKKAIASAWLAVPSDSVLPNDHQEVAEIRKCLEILLQSAEKAGAKEDLNEAQMIKNKIERK